MTATPPWLRTATLKDAREHGLRPKEFETVTSTLGRDINMVELGICSALFSEHCSYKSTKVHLRNLPTSGTRVIVGPGENACVVDIGDGEAAVFKVESHNHPSFIEPFQGAATGVGGILRDIFTMGARPIALLNSLRFGDLELAKTRYLLRRAVNGIGFYGNCMGIPTVGGELAFHPLFSGNCLVNAFALGVVKQDEVFLGKATGAGNIVLYVGSKTGRDGIHGASMSSESFGEDSEAKRPTVQVGDPFQEKLLLEACLEAFRSGHILGIQDMGAAGLTSSAFEMADRGGAGVRLDLDRVPQREENMNPYEIMLSESQERMLIIVAAGREREVAQIFEHWELDAVAIGEVTEGGKVELYWHGELVSSIPAHVLTSSVPEYTWPEEPSPEAARTTPVELRSIPVPNDLRGLWIKLLGSPNLCSRHAVYDQYDSTVRGDTVVHPGSDAGVVRLKNTVHLENTTQKEKALAISLDCNSRFCSIDPRRGTGHSLAEGCRNIAAVGAIPIGISDCLNMPSPERAETMWQIAECIRGLGDASRAFDVPVVSGNVSLYNETSGVGIQPTPTLAVVGLLSDATVATQTAFQNEGDVVLVLGPTLETEIGGSEYLAYVHGIEAGAIPELNFDREKRACDCVRTLVNKRLLSSCHDLAQGGLGIGLAECCFRPYLASLGARIAPLQKVHRGDAFLFAETGARFIISCSKENGEEVRRIVNDFGLTVSCEGTVGGDTIAVEGVAEIPLSKAFEAWWTGLDSVFDAA